MRRALALVLLVVAVVCSPAGVCLIDGMAAAPPAAAPGHACCSPARGTMLVASNDACCSMPRDGFVNVLRFALPGQAIAVAVDFHLAAETPLRLTASPAVTIRPPLVLRI